MRQTVTAIAPPQTHDFRDAARSWGHDIAYTPINGGQQLSATGWARGISDGDFILLSRGEGDTRYVVEAVAYYPHPPDMWTAMLAFAPRTAMAPR